MAIGGRIGGERLMAQFLDSKQSGRFIFFVLVTAIDDDDYAGI